MCFYITLRELIDLGWLYAVAESSAAFVAIVAAFFTTKILSIASERKTLSNRVKLLTKEIEQRNHIVEMYQKDIDRIWFKWAGETVDPFLEDAKYDANPDSPPSLEELIDAFKQKESRTPNQYEQGLLERKYAVFVDEVKKLAKEREEARKAFAKSPYSVLGQLFGATRELRMLTTRLKLPEQVRREVEELEKAEDKQEEELKAVALLELRKNEYEEQSQSISFPKYVWFGFSSLVYFAIVGVAVPLAYVLLAAQFQQYILESHVFFLFLSGLIIVFLYLYLEIRQAVS